MLTGTASDCLPLGKCCTKHKGEYIGVVSFSKHCGYRGVLRLCAVLCAPLAVTVRSPVSVKEGEKFSLSGGSFRITGGDNVKEILLLQPFQKAQVPLAADKQICRKKSGQAVLKWKEVMPPMDWPVV